MCGFRHTLGVLQNVAATGELLETSAHIEEKESLLCIVGDPFSLMDPRGVQVFASDNRLSVKGIVTCILDNLTVCQFTLKHILI